MPRMTQPLPYLHGYPEHLLARVRQLIARDELAGYLQSRYPDPHDIQSDRALFDYLNSLRQRHLRYAPPLARVRYDNTLDVLHNALGLHTRASRVHGGQLKARQEIRIASLFREAPAEFLRMIAVHELAHCREREHNKAFYQLCEHMLPGYAQVEFDCRLYLTARDLRASTST